MKKRFAVFDVDGTIFRWQLYHELFDAFVEHDLIGPDKSSAVFEARESWRTRQTDYETYEMTLVRVMRDVVVGTDATAFDEIADEILRLKGHRVYRYTLELMQDLKRRGYVIIAISGSYQQLVDRFAKIHAIDIAVGRQHTIVNGKLTAETNDVFGRKDEILKNIVKEHGLSWDDAYAVGDSGGDTTMLELVDNPLAFNPDTALRERAMELGWPIVIERKSHAYRLEKGSDGTYVLA